jgi:hypothetical protein
LAQSRVATKKADAGFCKKEEPTFITGSILHNPAEEPLELKQANLPNLRPSSKLHAARDARRNEAIVRKGVGDGVAELFDTAEKERAQQQAQEDADFSEFVARQRDYVQTQRNQDLSARARQEAAEFDAAEQAKRELAAKPPVNVFNALLSATGDPTKKLLSGGKFVAKDLSGGLNSVLKDNKIGITTPVKMVGGLIGASQEGVTGQIGKMLSGDEKSDKTKQHFQALTDTEHEQALKTIRAKGVLHDLVINDPVISGHDPQDVAMAFNEIAELAPNLVDSPGMIQSVLRKRLEAGSLADFDVKQILEMDKLRAERDKILAETRDIRTNRLM